MADAAGSGPTARPPGITWAWSDALVGFAYALPAGLVALDDVTRGVAFAVGVLPPAVVGLAPLRRSRRSSAVLGVFVGAPILVGAIVASIPILAVAVLFAAAVGATALARRSRLGTIAMTLGLPMIGIGFSFTDVGSAAGLAAVMVVGGVYACGISLLWPERPVPPTPPQAPTLPTMEYGLLLGGAGATAAAIGFALDFDHVGWACAAALLVMRPSAEMQQLRSVGRILAVTVGALIAVGFIRLDPADGWYALVAVAAISAVAATHRSRWYITAGFTTFLVFVLLLYANPAEAASRFDERVGETILGVGLACFYGLIIPALLNRRRPAVP